MKRITIGSVMLILAIKADSQQFYFPQKAYTDTTEMNRAIPYLANQLIHYLDKSPHSDSNEYYEELFRYQIAAGKFGEALNSFNVLSQRIAVTDSSLAQTIYVVHRAYATVKFRQGRTGRPVNTVVTNLLTMQFKTFPKDQWRDIEAQFQVDMEPMQKKYTDKKNELEKLNSDSLNYEEARSLCVSYTDYRVHVTLLPVALPVLGQIKSLNYSFLDSVLITARDGAVLSARIAIKKNISHPLPVILMFSIYPGLPNNKLKLQSWADNDYVGVVAFTRGKYLSPHEVEPFEHDAEDAYDLIEWIGKQPWCNGKIGMVGGSYNGFAQWAAVKKIHPALKTIVPMAAVCPGVDQPQTNGVFSSSSLRWIFMATGAQKDIALKFGNQEGWDSVFTTWYKSGRSYKSLDTIAGKPNNIFQRWLQHPSYDAFYQRMTPYKEEFENINIPVLTITGYFDGDQLGALHYFNEHYKYHKNPEHYLVIGPYDHNGAQGRQVSPVAGYNLDPAAIISVDELALQWFNYILKDSSKPALLKDRINFQVMGTNAWRHVSSMPQMNNDTLTFYFSNKKTGEHYRLLHNPELKKTHIKQSIDFKDKSIIPRDTLCELSFISDRLEDTLSINGRFLANLHTIVNKKDMDIEMQLLEMQPDEKLLYLSSFVGRSSHLKNREKRQLLQPGKEETIPVRQTEFISKQLSKGSRLVLKLGIIKDSKYQLNYGTGKDVSDETIADGKNPLEIKWLSDSWIKIPVYK